MTSLLILAAAAVTCLSPSVHDGDSIRCGKERIRLVSIDAPEMPDSPKCRDKRRANAWCDYRLAVKSRDALADFLKRGPVKIVRLGKDPYGRTLARVSVNGVDAGDYLVSRGLAKPWR